ncbi:MAG: DUF1273 domain-containing protein [Clostridiales bacterium]|jgi:uncharacterized phage-like protein YoqJ|nr:DUF1273 domain-containing protein [Clostridiales bacterium]
MQKICFTGHRSISEDRIRDIKDEITRILISLADEDITTTLYNGGAKGFDLLAAETAIALKMRGLPIKLIMVLPSKDYTKNWSPAERAHLHNVLIEANETIYLTEKYYDGCMKVRNQYLVKCSNVCIAYMINKRSGTGQTVRFARERGLTIINLAQ